MKLQVLSLGLAMAAFSAVGGETGVPEAATPAAAAGGVPEKAERGMRIDAMEARAARRFGRVDADGDGKVTPEEFAAGRIGRPEGRQGRGERHGDRDGDRRKGGRREHASARRPGRGPGGFGLADEAVFDAADADGDGRLTKEEWRALPQAAQALFRQRMFARLDANEDGVLEPGEFPPDIARLKALDADGDGRVTRRELRAGGKRGSRWRGEADG